MGKVALVSFQLPPMDLFWSDVAPVIKFPELASIAIETFVLSTDMLSMLPEMSSIILEPSSTVPKLSSIFAEPSSIVPEPSVIVPEPSAIILNQLSVQNVNVEK